MRKIDALVRYALMTAFTCTFAGISGADDNADQIAALDGIDRAITDSKTVADRSITTLEQLRKELYRTAVQTRDAKRMAQEIEDALEKGDDVKADLLQLQKDILDAGIILRDVNNQLKRFSIITRNSTEKMNTLESEIEAVKLEIVNPSDARKAAGKKLVAKLEDQVAKANDLAEQRGRVIERLNSKIKELKESKGVEPDPLIVDRYVDPDIKRATDLLNAGDIEKALLLFDKAMNENPDSDEARLGVAACYFEQGETEISKRMIEEVLNRDDSNPRAMGQMGALYYSEGKLKKAKKLLEKALRFDDADARNLNYLGAVLFQMGRQDDGIEKVQQAVELDPSLIAAQYNLAVMFASVDDPDLTAAGIHYRKALALGSPNDPIMDQLLGMETDDEVSQ